MNKYYNINLRIIAIISSFFLVACEPKLDGTNRNTMDESIKKVALKLPEKKLRDFEKCVFCILKNEEYTNALKILDNLTVDDVIALGTLKQEIVDNGKKLKSEKSSLEAFNTEIKHYKELRTNYENIIKAILDKRINFDDIFNKSSKLKNLLNNSPKEIADRISIDLSTYIYWLENEKLFDALIEKPKLIEDISDVEEWEQKTISIYDSLNSIEILKCNEQPIDNYSNKICFLVKNSNKKPVYELTFSIKAHGTEFKETFDLKNDPIMPGKTKEIFVKYDLYKPKTADKISAKCISINFSSDYHGLGISVFDAYGPIELDIYDSTHKLREISYEDIARKKMLTEIISKLVSEQQRIIDSYYPEYIKYLKRKSDRCISKTAELEELRAISIKEIGEIESVYNQLESKYADMLSKLK